MVALMNASSDSDWLSLNEAAELLGVHPSTVHNIFILNCIYNKMAV